MSSRRERRGREETEGVVVTPIEIAVEEIDTWDDRNKVKHTPGGEYIVRAVETYYTPSVTYTDEEMAALKEAARFVLETWNETEKKERGDREAFLLKAIEAARTNGDYGSARAVQAVRELIQGKSGGDEMGDDTPESLV